MAALTEAAGKAGKLKQNLEGAAAATNRVAQNAKEVSRETKQASQNVSQMSNIERNLTFQSTLQGMRQIQRLAQSIVSVMSGILRFQKIPREFEIRMAEINRKITYKGVGLANWGWWHDLDFSKLHLEELRKFDIAARASGSTAKNVKALQYSMEKFGGTAQDALRWTKSMQSNLADMEWGGEGGALGQVAFEYGLDFTGNETDKEIDEKIANLLDTLPKRQQVRVAQMLGIDDANFMRLTEKDANGKLTLKSSQEWGEEKANKNITDNVLGKSEEVMNLKAIENVRKEFADLEVALEKYPEILRSIKETIRKTKDDELKKYEDKKFEREQTQKGNDVENDFAEQEKDLSMWSTGLGIGAGILGTIGGLYSTASMLGLVGGTSAAAGTTAAAATTTATTGTAVGGATSAAGGAVLGLTASLPLLFAGIAEQQNMVNDYLKGDTKREDLGWFRSAMIGDNMLDFADRARSKGSKEAAARVDAAISNYNDAKTGKIDAIPSDLLMSAWQTNTRPTIGADPSGESLKKLNAFVAQLSQSEAQDVLDEINRKNYKGETRGFRVDSSTMDALTKRAKNLEVTTEGADAAMRTAGSNVNSANIASAESPSLTSSTTSQTVDSHDSITVKVDSGTQVGPTIESLKRMQQEKNGIYSNQNENQNTSYGIASPSLY